MKIEVLKSKIHKVRVTEADINYIGSISIDESLMEASNLVIGEKVQVLNLTNGERLETYVIKGEKNSGDICINGAAAHLVHPQDIIIIVSYAIMTKDEAENFKPSVVYPNDLNEI